MRACHCPTDLFLGRPYRKSADLSLSGRSVFYSLPPKPPKHVQGIWSDSVVSTTLSDSTLRSGFQARTGYPPALLALGELLLQRGDLSGKRMALGMFEQYAALQEKPSEYVVKTIERLSLFLERAQ